MLVLKNYNIVKFQKKIRTLGGSVVNLFHLFFLVLYSVFLYTCILHN